MDILRTLCVLYLGITFIKCAPVNGSSPTLYNIILSQCPSVASLPNYKDQPIMKSCSNWELINKTLTITPEHKKNVLCLLYFTSFTYYCSQVKEVNTTLPSVPPNVDTICDNLNVIPKKIIYKSYINNIIQTEEDCKTLCSDDVGLVEAVCGVSYYYSNMNFDTPHKEDIKNHFLPVKDNSAPKVVEDSTTLNNVPAPTVKDTTTSKHSEAIKYIPHDSEALAQSDIQKESQNSNGVLLPGVKNINEKKDVVNSMEAPTHLENPDVPLNKTKSETKVDTISIYNNHPKAEVKLPVITSPPKPEVAPANANVNQNIDNEVGNVDSDVPLKDGDIQTNDHVDSDEDLAEITNEQNEKSLKPMQTDETDAVNFSTDMDGDSYFFTYFMLLCIIFIVGYVCYHNKQKILALILEGRRGKRQCRGRRPNSANYHKLDCNLEEAITSSCNKNTNNVIY